jgi:prepilin-type N-terminal cleavage/methylation domain-containing protein
MRTITRKSGFTLVEIIITLIAAGILGTIFINLMSTALSDSWQSVAIVNNEARVVRKMEELVAVYVKETNTSPDTAHKTIHDNIGAGTYDETDPYPITVTAEYIKFVSGAEQAGVEQDNTVKVTVIAGDSRLTTIFTKMRQTGDPVVRY